MMLSRMIPLVLLAAVMAAAQAEGAGTAPGSLTGTVLETVNAAGYTYVSFDTGEGKVWAAAPECVVAVGETVTISNPMPMRDYHSKTLDRTFELVYFVGGVEVEGAERRSTAAPSGRPSWARGGRAGVAKGVEVDLSGIERAAGGKTVEELYAGKADLSDQEIVVRGRVVKFMSGIMGRNWLHLRDGTGEPGSDDLTVTTDAMVEMGSTVLVRGKITTDKDFGAGYRYELIIEDAEITVE